MSVGNVQCKLAVKVNAANLECNFLLNCQTVGRVFLIRTELPRTRNVWINQVWQYTMPCFPVLNLFTCVLNQPSLCWKWNWSPLIWFSNFRTVSCLLVVALGHSLWRLLAFYEHFMPGLGEGKCEQSMKMLLLSCYWLVPAWLWSCHEVS